MGRRLRLGALIILLVLGFASPVFADGLFVQSPLYPSDVDYSYSTQLGLTSTALEIPSNPVLLALGDVTYPVTPGDTFKLVYSDSKNYITLSLQADSLCTVAIPSIGAIDAKGLTFTEFKAKVEALVSTYYPYSSPQLTLEGCGLFSVKVSGEVLYATHVTAWGLSRLSDLAYLADDYASTREVQITYSDGTTKTYDLYMAVKKGSSEQNPLLEPGCEVKFLKAEKTVSISGAVKKEGVYQPLEGENLGDLVENYCDGLFNYADTSSITVTNYVDGTYSAVTLTDSWKEYEVKDGDVISVGSSSQAMPYVTITGAISAKADGSISTSAASKVLYSFVPGETAQQLIRNISDLLLASSDTDGIYIIRGDEKISVDGQEALTSDGKGEIELQQGDTIVIPFSQLFVTVNGAVNNPGNYAYVPDRTIEYYINLAGGYSSNARTDKQVNVFDKDGKQLKKVEYVDAQSTITVVKSTFQTDITLTVSILSIVTSVLTIITGVMNLTK